jgi:protein SCO1/2
MRGRLTLILICLVAVAIIVATLLRGPQPASEGAPAGGDFVLQSADGPVDTATLRGKVLLIYFGYTYCPDICPTTLVAVGQALKQLTPAELAQVKTIFVSVDPARDTPQRLKEYATFFHPDIIGVTGSPDQVAAVARLYGAVYARHDVGGGDKYYVVDHSAWTYLVAPDGRLATRIAYGTSAEQMLAEIRQWLPPTNQKGTP